MINLIEVLKHPDALKFAKESKNALKNGQITVNNVVVKQNIELKVYEGSMEEIGDFFYWPARRFPEITKLFLLYDAATFFDEEPWPEGIYSKYKNCIDFVSGHLCIKVAKNKRFVFIKHA